MQISLILTKLHSRYDRFLEDKEGLRDVGIAQLHIEMGFKCRVEDASRIIELCM